ncbi:DUF4157 domain-containing protein [Streptomyces sp. GC420]|uniref:eCIS core domain-containing protein n=1 Tax=Streptomyces sp. GC420 TaxID=2697568 RepID=UPI001AA1A865|nr:DUF4157 domain-containing protein [Streptomyces sp. GC420]NBM20336.1 DUF4157 domain-containing protein [Streptomyces sp. GC420]
MAAQRPPRDEQKSHKGLHPARSAFPYPADRLPAVGRLSSLGSAGLLSLQRLAGNAALGHAIQRERAADRAADQGEGQTSVQRSVQDVLRGSGQPLDHETRTDMEARFQADFSDVRLHTDRAAQESAAAVGARAYTSGSHVVIGESGADRHTLAHELTHVIQQRSGPVAGSDRGDGVRVSDPGDRFEREAEEQATRVLGSAPPARTEHAHTEHAHTEHAHTAHGHASQSGIPLQRAPLRSSAAAQEDQYFQMSDLVAMWVPAEDFDADGNLVQVPDRAYAGERQGYGVDALRVPSASLPRLTASRRGGTLQDSWQVDFQTSFFVYRVELINSDLQHSHTLIDPGRSFRIIRMTPKGSGGRSMGRTYKFGDYWGINPAYTGGRDPEELAGLRGLDEDNRVGADTTGLIQLPTDPSQPFVFYKRNIVDPSFAYADGTSNNSRRFLSVADFDAKANRAEAAGRGKLRRQVRVSRPPTVGRADAGRNPAGAMGHMPAHALMPVTGHGGGAGRRASHEWCHLIGDGDNGPTEFRNLVVGTNAVNTEQLAMETALRDYRTRFLGLGYAIRLTVEAVLERTEAESPNVPGGPYHKADWISFMIDIIENPAHGAGSADVDGAVSVSGTVHRQVMDAKRGTITESEFTSLHNEVRNKLRGVHADLREQQEQARGRSSRYGSPMSIGS